MSTILSVVVIILALILIVATLLQVKGTGSGLFGGAIVVAETRLDTSRS